VVLGGQVSKWSDILSKAVLCKVLKFADDTKIHCTVDSVERIESMQVDLRNLVLWSNEWHMCNADKCKVMHWSTIILRK